jgi:hypothetical protein
MGARLRRASAVLLLAAVAWPALAQTCRVLDPELQGMYKGDCRNGLADGQGEARGQAEYRGGFRAGRKHGHGVKVWPSGDRYEGEFVEDRKQGTGIYTWGDRGPAAGDRYSGQYVADRRQGFGTYTWRSGDVYAGQWSEDRPAGPLPGPILDRARAEKEQEIGVARIGARVCRQLRVGIAERDWIRGEVIATQPGRIDVRIDEAGRLPRVVNGMTLVKGSVVTGAASDWTPCL